MTAAGIRESIERMAREIADRNRDIGRVALLGILRRGRPLAERLAERIFALTEHRPPVGSLATTLYRDDVRAGKAAASTSKGQTHFDFDVNDQTVILVDDVIYAGRTARAAMDELMDYGRPARIQLACLIDRGLRDLPIQPDYLGAKIDSDPPDHVTVRLEEIDGEDIVVLNRPVAETA